MDVNEFIAQLRVQLKEVASDLPFRFVDTKEQDAIEYLSRRINCEGYSEEEISAVEKEMGCNFPSLFREFLLQMGKNSSVLFDGDTWIEISEVPGTFQYLKECVDETNEDNKIYSEESGEQYVEIELAIPDKAVIFMHHQGYQYFYFLPGEEEDPKIYIANEYDEIHDLGLFSDLLINSLKDRQRFKEIADENGGWFLCIEDGSTRQIFPAGNVRPLDYGHDIIEKRPLRIRFRRWIESLFRR